MTFIEKKFEIPALDGISQKTVDEHLKLYAGYVKHANLIQEKLKELYKDQPANVYVIGELHRRFGFEFDGMRNHELYFDQLQGSASPLSSDSALAQKISATWGSVETWMIEFKSLCLTRGIGWSILHYDKNTDTLINSWIEEQHLGHLAGVDIVYALDMWEHSYMLDYVPSEKKNYVESFIKNTNFSVLEKRFEALQS